MNGILCRDCREDHETSLDALRCAERFSDACGCGKCVNCIMAKQWREHPSYVSINNNQESDNHE